MNKEDQEIDAGLIAQWVIDNRYPQNEHSKVSDAEMFHFLKENILKHASQFEGKQGWVKAEDDPLITIDEKGVWTCTEVGDKEFIAALEVYNNKTGKWSWWIRHCVIEDRIGLCVVGDSDNEPAGWDIKDVTYYMPLPKPPGESADNPTVDSIRVKEAKERHKLQEENEKLLGLTKEGFFALNREWGKTPEQINRSWEQFKTENNLS